MKTAAFEHPDFAHINIGLNINEDLAMTQGGRTFVIHRDQAVGLHAWLGEYIEETAPKLPTTLDSVIRARLRRLGEVWSLTLGEDPITEERYWMRWDGVRIEPEEIEGWAVLFDANSVIDAEEAL